MRSLRNNDPHPLSRRRIIRHSLASGAVLSAGVLVVGLTQIGGAPVSSTTTHPGSSGCYRTTVTPAAFHAGVTTTTTRPRTVTKYATKTVTKTVTRTRTVTRTKTICVTKTVTVTVKTTDDTTTNGTTTNGTTSDYTTSENTTSETSTNGTETDQ
jgi:hypothetical protein